MADVMELLDHIRREQDNFPAAQKKVAAFVVENYQQIAFLPISALSQRVGVSDNTVIKFCNHLGYEKFTEFKKEFTSYAHSELLIYNKIGGETAPVSEGDSVSCGDVLACVGSSAGEEGETAFLHFAVTADGQAVDPMDYLSGS